LTRYAQFVANIFKSFIRQPGESLRILRALPLMVSGSLRARGWPGSFTERSANSSCAHEISENGLNPLRLYFESHKEGRGLSNGYVTSTSIENTSKNLSARKSNYNSGNRRLQRRKSQAVEALFRFEVPGLRHRYSKRMQAIVTLEEMLPHIRSGVFTCVKISIVTTMNLPLISTVCQIA
jgi:hypothetical protein